MFGVRLEQDDDGVETVGGLLAQALGRVPIPGATARIGILELVAEGARGRRNRVATVVVRRFDDAVPSESTPSESVPVDADDAVLAPSDVVIDTAGSLDAVRDRSDV